MAFNPEMAAAIAAQAAKLAKNATTELKTSVSVEKPVVPARPVVPPRPKVNMASQDTASFSAKEEPKAATTPHTPDPGDRATLSESARKAKKGPLPPNPPVQKILASIQEKADQKVATELGLDPKSPQGQVQSLHIQAEALAKSIQARKPIHGGSPKQQFIQNDLETEHARILQRIEEAEAKVAAKPSQTPPPRPARTNLPQQKGLNSPPPRPPRINPPQRDASDSPPPLPPNKPKFQQAPPVPKRAPISAQEGQGSTRDLSSPPPLTPREQTISPPNVQRSLDTPPTLSLEERKANAEKIYLEKWKKENPGQALPPELKAVETRVARQDRIDFLTSHIAGLDKGIAGSVEGTKALLMQRRQEAAMEKHVLVRDGLVEAAQAADKKSPTTSKSLTGLHIRETLRNKLRKLSSPTAPGEGLSSAQPRTSSGGDLSASSSPKRHSSSSNGELDAPLDEEAINKALVDAKKQQAEQGKLMAAVQKDMDATLKQHDEFNNRLAEVFAPSAEEEEATNAELAALAREGSESPKAAPKALTTSASKPKKPVRYIDLAGPEQAAKFDLNRGYSKASAQYRAMDKKLREKLEATSDRQQKKKLENFQKLNQQRFDAVGAAKKQGNLPEVERLNGLTLVQYKAELDAQELL